MAAETSATFQRSYFNWKAGETYDVPTGLARTLALRGVCVLCESEPKPKAKAKKPRKAKRAD